MADTWWFCLRHHAVEPYDGCKAEERLGPYGRYEEAAEALKRVQQRNTEWDEDPRFAEDEDEDDREGWGPFRH
ncbi:hypothetical protein [Propionicicella superfundia]|uniref:hypothetical protein n=1 Tax=Propionicicella superfundia TaxID=348582 RepID=UPI00041D44A6|nr:hypothetical protein [Propionicicella superfundia]